MFKYSTDVIAVLPQAVLRAALRLLQHPVAVHVVYQHLSPPDI